jgi:hypothetical protein
MLEKNLTLYEGKKQSVGDVVFLVISAQNGEERITIA